MAMSPEEKRERDRARKARQRAAKRDAAVLEALPQIGPGSRAKRGTSGGTQGGTPDRDDLDDLSNLGAAKDVIRGLDVPASARWRLALILQLAQDLDAPLAIPQRAGLAARYEANLEALIADCKPRERDELDELRRSFYQGRTSGLDDDPEAPQRRAVRKKA